MTRTNSHADVWVIDQDRACLLRHDATAPSGWQQEMNVPFEEFMGSAIALSSFSQSDTRVFYTLQSGTTGTGENNGAHLTETCWLGIKEDPLRLVQAHAGHSQRNIKALQTMGRKVNVISCTDPTQFERATPLMLTNPCEKKHLEKWIAASRENGRSHTTRLGLLKNLWVRPEPAYQTLRLVALCCTFLSLTIAHHQSEFQMRRQLDYFAQHMQVTLKNAQEISVSASWYDWGIQLGKFGKDKRANLNAVSIHWNEDGHVHTQATLNKDRKRVPKGCTLETSQRATCSTKGLTR